MGLLTKHKHKNTEKKKTPKNKKKTDPKNTFLHFGKQPLMFGNFFKLHSFMSASCVLLKTL